MPQAELDLCSLYEAHARSCDPKDFQGQVMRTPHGKPIGGDQVDLLVDGVMRGLHIEPTDVVLDLCCGNGAITDRILSRCRGGVGVDFTPYLIEVAKANFERPPGCFYRLADVQDYTETTNNADRFTKAMCYGAFQCLSAVKAVATLSALRHRFPNVRQVFLGNLPDLDKVDFFFREVLATELWALEDLKRHDTLFGIWRSANEITKLAMECGWQTTILRMPPEYYCAHYRFDAVLTPP